MEKKCFGGMCDMGNDCNEITVETEKTPDPAELVPLYMQAGWWSPEYQLDDMLRLVTGSHAFACARCGGRLVGSARAISDAAGDAYVLDVVVDERLRGQGIARRIVEKLVDHLKAQGMNWIVCISVPGAESLYERCGGKRMDGHVPFRF
ncbi:MAG: GNAT family N-acetyltransferase [Victivallaceae bacterium]|nr:GNAT family N-acetyltransferase [Victivallaceae bacterium]